MVFTVTLSGAVAGGFSVDYETIDGSATGSATSTAFRDYSSQSGTLTFTGTDGEWHTVTADIFEDYRVELNETFSLELDGLDPAGSVTLPGPAQYTILDDDSALITIEPYLTNDPNDPDDVSEEVLYETNHDFKVVLDHLVDTDIYVTYRTVDGSAHSGEDFTGTTSATATILAHEYIGYIDITVSDDWKVEADENFSVELLSVDASDRDVDLGATTTAQETLENDDIAKIRLVMESNLTSRDEGEQFTVIAKLMHVYPNGSEAEGATSDQNVVVPITTSDGTAQESGTGVGQNDYDGFPSGYNLTISAGSSSASAYIATNDDSVVEGNETLTVTPGSPTVNGRPITDATAAIGLTILNEDGTATFIIDDQSISIATITGYTDITFTVYMTAAVDHNVTIGFHNEDHGASSSYTSQEYLVLTQGNLTFTPGQTSKTITVRVFDTIDSGDQFYIWLDDVGSLGSGVSLSNNTVKGTGTAQ
jgi:hypothetical protein